MANERQATELAEIRALCAEIDDKLTKLDQLRDRFNSLGGAAGFKGAGLLFAADGSGQEIPYDDFYGCFTSLGTLEGTSGTPAAAWSAFKAVLQRARG